MKKNFTIFFAVLLLALSITVTGQRTLITAIGISGVGWNQPFNWVTATGEHRIPMDNDSIVIPAGITITLGYARNDRHLTNIILDVFGTFIVGQPPVNDGTIIDASIRLENNLFITTTTDNPAAPVIRVGPNGTISTQTVAGGGKANIYVIVNNDPGKMQIKYSTEDVGMVTFGQQAMGTIMGPARAVNTYMAQPKFFVLGGAASLPVSISAFTATVNSSSTVVLNWTSQQEVNSKKYIIERSNDGNNNWQQIGSVQAAGQSSIASNYKFEDKTASAVNYYRLGMADANAAITYSKTLIVRLKNAGANVTLYPNPAVNSANITVNDASLAQQGFSLSVLNQSGLLVAQKKPAKGTTQLSLDLSAYKAGIYTIDILFVNGLRETHKLVVTK